MRRRRRSGFTVIELVVVVAVLALLAGILLPVLSRAREQGRVTKCVSNEHQVFLALKMYEEDYGQLPVEYGPSGKDVWLVMLRPYLKNSGVLLCDSDATHGRTYAEAGYACSYNYQYTQAALWISGGPKPAYSPYRQPKLTSPLFICSSHFPAYQCIMCRYDGSIELAPPRRYPSIGIEFE